MKIKNELIWLFLVIFAISLNLGCKKETVTVTNTETVTVLKYPPKITLIGNSSMKILVFSTYVEQGATATDKEDGNLTPAIVITGNINTGVVGTYTFKYAVSDSEGNKDSVNRIVQVVADSIVPSLSLLGGSNITLSLNTPFVDPGFIAIDNIQGNLTSSVIVTGSVNKDLVGTYTLTYQVSDNSGNTAILFRDITVKNDADYLVGNYSVTEVRLTASPSTVNYTQSISASPTINNRIVFSKFNDLVNNTAIYVDITGSVLNPLSVQSVNGAGPNSCNYSFVQFNTNTTTIALISGKWNFSLKFQTNYLGGGGSCLSAAFNLYDATFVQQ